MNLAELAKYAEEKYQIREEYRWTDFPGFSILREPVTGKWLALLMRQWDCESGMEIERCDIKGGPLSPIQQTIPCLSQPYRMHGPKWVGVQIDQSTDASVVFYLFDAAVALERRFFTAAQSRGVNQAGLAYHDTSLPLMAPRRVVENPGIPPKIREMRKMDEPFVTKSIGFRYEMFCRQAKFMERYEDNAPWHGEFHRFFPTYHDLNTSQLRGYFTWRTWVRQGRYQRTSTAFAFIYIYELLNGFGVSSPEETLQKMREFKTGYLDSGIGDKNMKSYLSRWMMEYAVVKNFPLEVTLPLVPARTLETDQAMLVLLKPNMHSDEEICAALAFFSKKKIASTPVIAQCGDHGKNLWARVWKKAIALSSQTQVRDIFTKCFGSLKTFPWRPLYNAFCFSILDSGNLDYPLNDIHRFECRKGKWQEVKYYGLSYDFTSFEEFLHETDRKLRIFLKAGHALRERGEEAWATPFVEAVIDEEKRAALEAARPKITLDLSGLDQIREESLVTQNSLLTEEERLDAISISAERGSDSSKAPVVDDEETDESPVEIVPLSCSSSEPEVNPSSHLEPLHGQVLRLLLQGKSPAEFMKSHRLMPSIVADTINETFFDEIGDNVLDIDNDILSLVEDYREDVARILGEWR